MSFFPDRSLSGTLKLASSSLLLGMALMLQPLSLEAKIENRQFETNQQEALYQTLIQELRCLVCQNQNLADSNAELAQDLRQKTYQMVIDDKDRGQIVDYMVARYGDFVMYKPPLNMRTLILWLGPFVILLFAIGIAVVNLRKRNAEIDEPVSSTDNTSHRQQAKDILKSDSGNKQSENKKQGENQ